MAVLTETGIAGWTAAVQTEKATAGTTGAVQTGRAIAVLVVEAGAVETGRGQAEGMPVTREGREQRGGQG